MFTKRLSATTKTILVLLFVVCLLVAGQSVIFLRTPRYLEIVEGAVTSSAQVADNPVNQELKQVQQKEADLQEQQLQLDQQQAQMQQQYQTQKNRLWYLFAGAVLLVILSFLNLYLDRRRNKMVEIGKLQEK